MSNSNKAMGFTPLERTKNYVRQIKGAFVFKGLAVLTSFFAIPLTIKYLGVEQFGIWSTLLSVISWIFFFDLGIGNGLRNKLAESLAKKEIDKAAGYIASGYSLIGLAAATLYILVAALTFVVPWQQVFNTQAVAESDLRLSILITTFFIFLNFWIGLIHQVMGAVQITSVSAMGQFATNLIVLAMLFILTDFAASSIPLLAISYGVSVVGINVAISYWFYRRNRELTPRFSLENEHIRPMFTLGLQFFVIQMAVLIIYATDKILITQLLGPEYVAEYEVVFKLFSAITMIYSLIAAPLWSAYTEAFHTGDISWITKTIKNQIRIFLAVCAAITILVLVAKQIIHVWIAEDFKVSQPLVLSMGLFVIINTWNSIYSYVLNGIGAIRISMICAVSGMIANIPLAIFLTKSCNLEISGVVLAACISQIIFAVAGPTQIHFLLKKRQSVKQPI